jgi:hypothetical protein
MAARAYEVNATPGDRPLMSLLSSARPNGWRPECPEWPVNGPAMALSHLQQPSASTSSVTELRSAGSMTTGSLAPTEGTLARPGKTIKHGGVTSRSAARAAACGLIVTFV